VRTAADEPRRHGKHGELLIKYEETEEHRKRVGGVQHVENSGRSSDLDGGAEKAVEA